MITSAASINSDILSLDLSVRLWIFALCNLVLLIWTRFFMAAAKPGLQRFILFLPFFALTYFITCLFDRENPDEQTLTVYTTGTYFCINSLKAPAFCFNRGQLAKVLDSGSFAAFTVALLLPVNISFQEKPIAKSKKTDSEDSTVKKTVFEDVEYCLVTFKGITLLKEIASCIGRFCINALVCYLFASIAKRTEDFSFQQSAAHSWFLCFYLSTLQDANSLISLVTLNIDLSPNFVAPYLATSVSDFWAKRWNLIMQHLLRDNFYLPVIESSFVALPKRLTKKKTSLVRNIMAMINVFVASGLIHGYLMMVFMGTTEFPVLYSGFFVVNAFVVIFEKCLKTLLIKKGYYSESLSFFQFAILVLYTQAVVLPLAHFFFWPDLVRIRFIQPTVDGILQIGSMFV
eukprot:g6639.t1